MQIGNYFFPLTKTEFVHVPFASSLMDWKFGKPNERSQNIFRKTFKNGRKETIPFDYSMKVCLIDGSRKTIQSANYGLYTLYL